MASSLVSVALEEASPILPTAVHLDRQYQSLVGSVAIERYVEENRGRRVELVAQLIGEAASSIVGNEGGEDISRLSTQRGSRSMGHRWIAHCRAACSWDSSGCWVIRA